MSDLVEKYGQDDSVSSQFPDWAPESLVRHYRELAEQLEADRVVGVSYATAKKPDPELDPELEAELDSVPDPDAAFAAEFELDPEHLFVHTEMDVCRQLLRDNADMKSVWTSLAKPKWNFRSHVELVREITGELVEFPRRNFPRGRSRLLKKVAAEARALRELVLQCEDELTPAGFARIASRIDVRRLAGWLITQGVSEAESGRLARAISRWIQTESPRSEFATTFGDALRAIRTLAENGAKKQARLGKPGAKRAAACSLADRLVDFFERKLDTPLNAQVAALVSAAYRTTITEDDVKKVARSRRRRVMKAPG